MAQHTGTAIDIININNSYAIPHMNFLFKYVCCIYVV